MTRTDLGAEIGDVLDVSQSEFQTQVEEDAQVIKTEVTEGTFDNPQGLVGLEYEFYATTDGNTTDRNGETTSLQQGTLRRIPRRTLSFIGFEKELGLHNAEMSTTPQPLNEHGIEAQQAEIKARLAAARDPIHANNIRLVSDGLWTIPPSGETARGYLTDSIDDDGLTIATNMSDSVRYHAMCNTGTPTGGRLDVPNVSLEADTIMPESLITSIQPHYQVPNAEALPSYFRYAIRLAGPLLALGVNSPFFPPSLYDDSIAARTVMDDAWMGHRIKVFETSLNTDQVRKVRFPEEFETVEEAIDSIVADETIVPMPLERGERFDDEFAYFRRKHGTYWRWIRPVFGGATRSSANARIEFRPLPGQPTLRDAIAFQAVFAGALEHLYSSQHPVRQLKWDTARGNFYAAMHDGIDADLTWMTAEGRITTDLEVMYEELFSAAKSGLQAQGLRDEQVSQYIAPLRNRVRTRMTPARWKHRIASSRLSEGADLGQAIVDTQREYLERQSDTFLTGKFSDWNLS
ncbi:MAG: hypothetical protein ABEH88_00250 [Halobacteriales archaeon]